MRLTVIAFLLVALVLLCGFAVADTSHSPPATSITSQTVSPVEIAALHSTVISHDLTETLAIVNVEDVAPVNDSSAMLLTTSTTGKQSWRSHYVETRQARHRKLTASRRMWAYGQAVYPLRA